MEGTKEKEISMNVPLLDILKGICIIFVVMTHFWWPSEMRKQLLFPFWIDMAVPVFMVVSGYTNASSFKKYRINNMEEAYNTEFFWKRVVRFTSPVLIVLFLEEMVYFFLWKTTSLKRWIVDFSRGGVGPGSYYYPIMLQFILFFPFLWFLIKRNPKRGLITCFILNLIYEILQPAWNVTDEVYRLVGLRYIFAIAFGCFLFFYKKEIKKRWLCLSLVLGFTYILATMYFGYQPEIMIYWTGRTMIAVFWIIPVCYLLFWKLGNIRCRILEKLGKASYHIFLTQMVFYNFCSGLMQQLIPNKLAALLCCIIICLGIGMIFYYIETPINNLLVTRLNMFLKRKQ